MPVASVGREDEARPSGMRQRIQKHNRVPVTTSTHGFRGDPIAA
jgi:hypothetical protein